jgi:adenylate cyclase
MMAPELRVLRGALEGISASLLGTCDADGLPNASMISQVHWVDDAHVALSYQFFNKTRTNLLTTKQACVLVTDPGSLAFYRLDLDYVETRNSGPLFETMKAKLAGIASHHGLEKVFRLLGADIFRVVRDRGGRTAVVGAVLPGHIPPLGGTLLRSGSRALP